MVATRPSSGPQTLLAPGVVGAAAMPDNFEPLSSAGRVLACSLLSLIETQGPTAADLPFIDEVRITAAMQQDDHAFSNTQVAFEGNDH